MLIQTQVKSSILFLLLRCWWVIRNFNKRLLKLARNKMKRLMIKLDQMIADWERLRILKESNENYLEMWLLLTNLPKNNNKLLIKRVEKLLSLKTTLITNLKRIEMQTHQVLNLLKSEKVKMQFDNQAT